MMVKAQRQPASLVNDDRASLVEAGLVTLGFFTLVAFTQWVTFSVWGTGQIGFDATPGQALISLLIAVVPSALIILLFALLHGYRWSLGKRVVGLIVFPTLASAGRLVGLRFHWGEAVRGWPAAEELINGLVAPLLALVIGIYYVDAQDRTRRTQRLIAQREFEAKQALDDLETEELRVRRDVSQALHGKLQQRLVFVATRLAALVPQAAGAGNSLAAAELRELMDEVDELREAEVRQLSHQLYPTGLDIGFQAAVQLLIGRLPANIAVTYTVSPAAVDVDDVINPEFDIPDRMLLVSVLDEAITNALKHGQANQIEIGLDLEEIDSKTMVVVEVVDNGQTLPQGEPVEMSGLTHLASRLASRGGGLKLDGRANGGGAVLRFWIPRPPGRPLADGEQA